ncbi:hypothetical protein ACLRDC_20725 [Gluconacetobacter sacchari]|uniref:Abi-like protein n=2 Tax=Gluconacetobacter sacchari TaxID=92759 RepID=A0A7W4IH98_9PROT|nr:hypothetical protein [Gluconacetobacter sacchari]MBB2162848.1 hypothetical protein [Gluconacetobacter sacchari]GBQ23720.1 hypothetical protein AA12717_1574 [Gluconacetobacter sacchari DSM 12717]
MTSERKENPDTPAMLAAVRTSLSPERFATYLRASAGDPDLALRLHTRNTALSAGFYGPLQSVELTLRNTLHRALARRYGAAWFDNPATGLNAYAITEIAQTRAKLKRGRYVPDAPHTVAALSFGFWVALLGPGGSANYAMTLWRPALSAAFPHARLPRKTIHREFDHLRTFRNRIAHHEPIFTRHLAADYAKILTLAGWMCPLTRDWIARHSRIPTLLAADPAQESLF